MISLTISLLSWQRLSFWSAPSTLGTNFVQIFRIFSSSSIIVCSSHTDIKLCTFCLYRDMTVLIHEILYLVNQLWCSDFLTSPMPLIIPHRPPAFLESLMPLKKLNFIAYHSSRPVCIFKIHQQWQIGFSRVYSNSFSSCSFELEIIKIGQSSYKMYSNDILNFQDSTAILDPCTKKSGTYWRHVISICRSMYRSLCTHTHTRAHTRAHTRTQTHTHKCTIIQCASAEF